jgi:hypothetical protein
LDITRRSWTPLPDFHAYRKKIRWDVKEERIISDRSRQADDPRLPGAMEDELTLFSERYSSFPPRRKLL